MTYNAQHAAYLALCEQAVTQAAEHFMRYGASGEEESTVGRAAAYSLLNGGKRVRGVLLLAVCDMLGGDIQAAAPLAAAQEMVHAFSLIHDDLPCMDNDDMRRGKPACHIAFGEAAALLAGDMLAAAALEEAAAVSAEAVQCLAGATRSMIYGQELDMRYENEPADEAALHAIHRHKTGALLCAAARLGALAAGVQGEKAEAAAAYAAQVGLVFQIVDDILDVTGDEKTLGKPVGSDVKQAKTTFVTLYGLQQAAEDARAITAQAVKDLQTQFGGRAAFLCEFAERLAQRAF